MKRACLIGSALFVCLGASAYADYEYRIEADNTVTITNYVGPGGKVAIPAEIEGRSVASIGPAAFADSDVLTGIAIPGSVASIGEGAFRYCYSLTDATIGDGVATIEDYAFYSCTSLTNLALGNRVATIGNGAFFYCGSLTGITIPASVTSIGEVAFLNCSSLTDLFVAEGNAVYSSSNGVLFNEAKTRLIQFPGGKGGDYLIPAGVATIGEEAFRYCYSLTGITIPDSVTSIGAKAFLNCASLAGMHVADANATYSSFGGVLFNKTRTRLIQCPGGKVGDYAVPGGVTRIEDFAFYGCSGLTGIALPDSVIAIGNDAFYGCSGLARATLGKNVSTIGNDAFFNCSGLAQMTLPASVASIGIDAFNGCTSLTAVFFQGPPPGTDEVVFDDGHPVVVYYLYGASGWEELFAGQPTAIWPEFLTAKIQPAGFVFEIVASENQEVVLEKCSNLGLSDWQPVSTNTMGAGPMEISIPDWADDLIRYYRLVLR